MSSYFQMGGSNMYFNHVDPPKVSFLSLSLSLNMRFQSAFEQDFDIGKWGVMVT